MNLYRAFATVGGLTLISRIAGFIRDILIAAGLGSGWLADAFFVAFRFPNLFRRLFGEGAFNAAFVPLYAKKLEGEGQESARRFAADALSGLTLTLVLFSAFMMLAMPWLMMLLAPGFADQPEKYDLAVLLTQIAFPYLLCMSLVALLSGVLNSMRRFVAAAAAPILLNVVLIAAMLVVFWFDLINTRQATILLAVAVTVAGLAQLAVVWVAVKRAGVRIGFTRPTLSPDIRRLVALGVPSLISGGVTQLNIVVGTIIASLQAGAVSYLYYADRLYQLPLGLVGVAIGVVLLPDLARHLRAGDRAAVVDSQNRSLEFALLLTLPAAVALAISAEPIVRVLFERGAFTGADTVATAWALVAFAVGLPAFVLIRVFQPAYFAREDTRTPMRWTIVNLMVNMIGSLALFFAFKAMGLMPHVGIALATSLAGWINAIGLWIGLQRTRDFEADARLVRNLPRILIASLVMGAVLLAVQHGLAAHLVAAVPLLVKMGALTALVGAGLLVYGGLILATGVISPAQIRRFLRV